MKSIIPTQYTSAHLRNLVLIILSISCLTLSASAQIVYSARYYYPAGQHKLSYYHLYYYNLATKHSKELTFGRWNDTHPRFSPNGRDIAFIRCRGFPAYMGKVAHLCVYSVIQSKLIREIPFSNDVWPLRIKWNESGNAVKVQTSKPIIIGSKTSHLNRYDWRYNISPGGKYRFLYSTKTPDLIKVFNLNNNQIIREYRSRYFHQVCWSGPSSLTALCIPVPGTPSNAIIYTWNVESSSQPVSINVSTKTTLHIDNQFDFTKILMIQSTISNFVLITEVFSNSSFGLVYSFQKLNVDTARVQELHGGQVLCFSRHWHRYITVPYRVLTQYGAKKNVWTQQLIINYVKNHQQQDLVYGMVDVRDADWRGGHRVCLNYYKTFNE